MDAALRLLEKNKPECIELFRQIFRHPETRYDAVKQSIAPIAKATSKEQVLSKPAHVSKYVRLIFVIVEHGPHLEHVNCEEWAVFARYLVVAYDHLKSALQGPEFVRSTHEIFQGLSFLLGSTESLNSSQFASIISICRDFLSYIARRETACHPYIMKCLRILTSLGFEAAAEVGQMVLQLDHFKSPSLVYEISLFSCLKPQHLDVLLDLGPCLIQSHEVEFVPAPELGCSWFRPSSEANLVSFAAALAMSLASTRTESHSSSDSSTFCKRFKIRERAVLSDGLKFMVDAFRLRQMEDIEVVLDRLKPNSSGRRGSSLAPESFNSSNSGSEICTSKSFYKDDLDNDEVKFWAFILLARQCELFTKCKMHLLWKICLESIQSDKASSAACFCLSRLTTELLKPVNIDGEVVDQIESLLGIMGGSSYPSLSSGSLTLYFTLLRTKIIDEKFQALVFQQLRKWMAAKVQSGPPVLLAQLFDSACPPAYLQAEIAEEIRDVMAVTRAQRYMMKITHDQTLSDFSSDLDNQSIELFLETIIPFEKCTPSFTSVPQWQPSSLTESLWSLAISARSGHRVSKSSQSKNDAFNDQDLRAFVWFANFANYFQWSETYCREALALASWELPARKSESILKAMEILRSPGPVVSAILSGFWSPHIKMSKSLGPELRAIEPILKCYNYQRSSNTLRNLAKILHLEIFQNINEAKQLRSFLTQVSSKHSEFSSLRWYCNTPENNLNFFASLRLQPDLPKLRLFMNQEHRSLILSFHEQSALEFASTFDHEFQVAVLVTLYHFKLISLARLCLSLTQFSAEPLNIERLLNRLGLQNPGISLVSLVKVPLLFVEIPSQRYMEVLNSLGASDFDADRLTMLNALETVEPERNDEYLYKNTEVLMRGCSCAANDNEISRCIHRLFIVIQAHRTQISIFLLLGFFKSALALLIAFKQREPVDERSQGSYIILSALIKTFVEPSEDFELRLSVSLLLHEAGYTTDAANLLASGPKAESSGVYDVICSLPISSIGEFPMLWNKINAIVSPLEYELRKTALWHAAEVSKTTESEDAIQPFDDLDKTCIRQLIEWTNYVTLPHNDSWLAILGRLAVKKDVLANEINMSRSLYAVSFPCCRVSNVIDGFEKVLKRVYQHLPYTKKWLLHPFLEQCGWRQDVEHSAEEDSKLSAQQVKTVDLAGLPQTGLLEKIVSLALRILDMPPLGADILDKVSELFLEAIPTLVSVAFGVEGRSKRATEYLDLRNDLIIGLLSPSAREDILRILKKCYELSQKLILPSLEIAQACVAHSKSTSSPLFVEFGWIAVEIAWNANPSEPISPSLQQCLEYFYAVKDDDLVCEHLPLYSSHQNLVDSLKGDKMVSPWQIMELEMAQSEALAQMKLPSSNELASSLKSAGLWNFAQQAFPNTGFYDLEKAWWLRQWDAATIYCLKKSSFDSFDGGTRGKSASIQLENTDYGAMMGYFTGRFSADEVYADLTQTKICMIRIFENVRILADDSQTSLKVPLKIEDDREYAVVQFGQEALLSAKGNVAGLAKCLKDSCEHFRKVNDKNNMLQCTIRLEELRQLNTPGDFNKADERLSAKELSWVSLFATARTQWELGKSSQAILTLKRLINSQELGIEKHQDLADAYGLLGTWSRHARDARDDAILQNYFLPALETATDDNKGRVQHLFARFCDDACHDETLLSAIEDSARVKENEQLQSEYLEKAIQSGTTDKTYQSRYRASLRMLRSEAENLEELKRRRLELTLRGIQAYLTSLKYGDEYEEDMGRFVALWLELYNIKEVNRLVRKSIFEPQEGSFALHKFIPWINQLSSRLGENDLSGFQTTLLKVVSQTAVKHPFHSLWPLVNILRTKSNSNKSSSGRKSAAKEVVHFVSDRLPSVVLNIIEFADRMAQLGNSKRTGEEKKVDLQNLVSNTANNWWKSRLTKMRLPVPTASIPICVDGDYRNIPCVESIESEIEIAGGISAPKIMTLVDSRGVNHKMVLKGSEKDDLRQDAIMQQVFQIANGLFSQTPNAKLARNLRVRTYNVIPLGGTCGAIEFVKNTKSLLDILEPLHQLYGGPSEYSLRKARQTLYAKRNFNAAIRLATFEEVMTHTKPQMRHFWTKRYRDPHDWLEAKTRWCRSTAVTSILGYIVGLGDRHCSNLLVDTATGEVVHIDLGIAFDQGKQLHIPETVPFRLTRDMVDGMGINGTAGVFTSAAEATLHSMREQRDRIMTIIEVLKHDTLYTWRLPPLRLNRIQSDSHHRTENVALEAPRLETGLAEQALRSVKQKLTATLSCEATVRDLIAQARSTENLAQIFSGWSPFY